ncbi:MAG: hypothetical protein WA949_23415 [Phormidesmis sp.]
MTALPTANISTLYAQHSLQSEDFLLICQLCDVENAIEQIQSFTFEQFFGFACHLFVTTDSSNVRRQLAGLFPKFGQIAILSLVKIAYHFDSHDKTTPAEYRKAHSKPHFQPEVQQLALQSLESMAAQTLAVGLAQIIEEDTQGILRQTVVSLLARTFYTNEEDILSLLSSHLSKDSWNAIETDLVRALSSPQPQRIASGKFHNLHALQARPQIAEPQLTEVA